MSMSSGAGSPVWFRCWKCRRLGEYGRGKGYAQMVTLTGRTKPHYPPRGSAMGARSVPVSREYKCQDCGHQGWSAHVDLAERATWAAVEGSQ